MHQVPVRKFVYMDKYRGTKDFCCVKSLSDNCWTTIRARIRTPPFAPSTTTSSALQVQLWLPCTTTVASEMLGSSSSSSEKYHYFHDDTRTTTLVEGRQVNNYRRRVRLLRERVPDDPGDLCCTKYPPPPSLTRTSTGKRVPLPSRTDGTTTSTTIVE